MGHIAYFIEPGAVLLCGDTLFSLGCGRLLEGTPTQMFESLCKLAALPPESLVCCGHEYTLSNAKFAVSEEPDNQALRARAEQVGSLRAAGRPHHPQPTFCRIGGKPISPCGRCRYAWRHS